MIVHLLVLVPGDVLRREDEPVVPAAALHDAQVVDGHVALPDDLGESVRTGLHRQLSSPKLE